MASAIKAKQNQDLRSPQRTKEDTRYAATSVIETLQPYVSQGHLLPDKTVDLIVAALDKALVQLAESL